MMEKQEDHKKANQSPMKASTSNLSSNQAKIKKSDEKPASNQPVPNFARQPQNNAKNDDKDQNKSNPVIYGDYYYQVSAIDAITYKIMTLQNKQLKQIAQFSPEYIGLFFSQSGKISGYKGLKVQVLLTPFYLKPYIKIQFERSANPDLVKKVFEQIYNRDANSDNIIKDENQFKEQISNELQSNSFIIQSGKNGSSRGIYEDQKCIVRIVFHINRSIDPKWIQKRSDNLQSLMLVTVQNTSPIVKEETFWNYFLIFVKKENGVEFAGFSTAYTFHRDAFRYRGRVSQILIIPSYRKIGLGMKLLRQMYYHFISDQNCFDITVEEASPEFHDFRDLCETEIAIDQAKKCMKIYVDKLKELKTKDGKFIKIQEFQGKWKKEWVEEIMQTVKVNRIRVSKQLAVDYSQAHRIAQIVMMLGTELSNPDQNLIWKKEIQRRIQAINKDNLNPHARTKMFLDNPKSHPVIMFTDGEVEQIIRIQDHDELDLQKAEILKFQLECMCLYC